MEEQAQGSVGVYIAIRVALWLFFGGVGFAIGKGKGKGTLGLILGLTLGVIGWIIIGFMSGDGGVVRTKVKRLRVNTARPGSPTATRPGSGTAARPGTRVGVGRPTRRRL